MANEWVTWAYEQDLQTSQKFVLVVLGDRADHEGYCWPSRKDIAQKTGLTERSVARAISTLEESGLIKVEERRRKDGFKSSNGYFLIKRPISGDTESPDNLSPDIESRDNDDQSQGTQSPDKDNNNKLLLSEPSVEPSSARARVREAMKKSFFEEWFEKYPHKVGQKRAQSAYRSAVKKITPQELLEALDRYLRDKPPDQKFLNPATWLNEERWNDQPSQPTGDKHASDQSSLREKSRNALGTVMSDLYGDENAAGDYQETVRIA